MSTRGVLSDRILEIVAVLLLGVATVGTAWCGLQSTLWNGEQDDLSMQAANQRVEASRLFGFAAQTIAYDANVLSQYADAVIEGDTRRQTFYRKVLMRPDFVPFLDKWAAELKAGSTPNLTEDSSYRQAISAKYREAEGTAEDLAQQASEAGQIGDAYVLTTVLLATSLFFAGVTSSFRYPVVRTALLVGCVLAIALAASRMIDLPVAPDTWALVP